MRFPRKRGSTSVIVRVFIPDNTVTTGAGVAGLTSASANLAIAYSRELQNGFTQITGANLVTITTIGTWSSPGTNKLGFKAVDATNAPGLYEIHFPDDAAAFGTGDTAQNVIINVLELTTTALKIGPNMVLIPLVPWDYQDGVRMGLTALPNAAAEAAGGLYTRGSGAGQIIQDANGRVNTNVTGVAGTTQTAGDIIGDTNDIQARLPAALTAGGNMKTDTLYAMGAVWIDTGAGAAGTTNYVHGTVTNPNSSMANARTIANSVNLTNFIVRSGSSVTLDQGYSGFNFYGDKWTLALANRSIVNSHFSGADVSGLSSGTGAEFHDCILGAVTIAQDSKFSRCGLSGTFTLGAAGNFIFDQCFSATTSGVDAVIDFGALGATTVALRGYAGGVEVRNMAAGDVFTFVGGGRVTIAASCTAGTVLISGTVTLVNNGSGQTITDTSRWNEDQNITNVTGNVTGSVGSVVAGVNMTAIDGQATAGNNATLNLKQLNIQNSAAEALYLKSTAANTSAAYAEGTGNGHGLQLKGGTAGAGLYAEGGSAGDGIAAQGHGVGGGIVAHGGDTSGPGLFAAGGDSGPGAQFNGGTTLGSGLVINATAGNSIGLAVVGNGTQAGLNVTGGATGDGAQVTAGGGNGHGVVATGSGSGDGFNAQGGSSGGGARVTGGTTGHGLMAFGGAGAGTRGLYAVGTGVGVELVGTAADSNGLYIFAPGTDPAVVAENGGTGDGIQAIGSAPGVDIRGDLTGNITGNVTGSVGSVAAGGIAAGSFVAGAIDATAIANGAIDAATFAAGAIDASAIANGAIDAATFAAGAITAAAIATDAIDADALAADALGEIADSVWDEAIAGHLGAGSTGAALNAAGAAGDPWAIPVPGLYAPGTAGQILGDNLDDTVTSRLAPTVAGNTLDVTATGAAGIDWANLENPSTAHNLSGTNIDVDQVVASVSGAVGSVTGGVTVTTNNDKTGYALTGAERNAIAAALLDLANGIETGVTLRQAQRLELAALAGKLSGAATTTVTIRNAVADTTDRIVATVDSDGNRTAITTNLA